MVVLVASAIFFGFLFLADLLICDNSVADLLLVFPCFWLLMFCVQWSLLWCCAFASGRVM
jgi:hypothetical protein